jgi:hypothetical protein
MTDNSNRSDPTKKDYTLSLSEKEIGNKLPAIIDYSNAYVLKNIQLNLVTNGLEKPVDVIVEVRPEGILTRRLEI